MEFRSGGTLRIRTIPVAQILNVPVAASQAMKSENESLIAATASAAQPIETDAVIVGAGPVGLFQVFELGLLEIKAHVVDSLPEVGGQCTELYPDKPIYDIPAIPVCSGKELTDALLNQIKPFGATFHLGHEVSTVQKQDDGRFLVETSKGTSFLTKVVIVAGGVGSFQPRTLKVEGVDRFAGKQLHYRVRDPVAVCGQTARHRRWWRLGARLGAGLCRQGGERRTCASTRRLSRRARLSGKDEGAIASSTRCRC